MGSVYYFMKISETLIIKQINWLKDIFGLSFSGYTDDFLGDSTLLVGDLEREMSSTCLGFTCFEMLSPLRGESIRSKLACFVVL
jgi:hypothetical protein